jgi:hypothetical protein
MTTEQEAASRAAFEVYAATVNNLVKNAAMLDRQPSGTYTWSGTAFAWDVWQARGQHDAEVMKAKDDLLGTALEALEDVVGNYSEMTAQNSFERRIYQGRIARARGAIASLTKALGR